MDCVILTLRSVARRCPLDRCWREGDRLFRLSNALVSYQFPERYQGDAASVTGNTPIPEVLPPNFSIR